MFLQVSLQRDFPLYKLSLSRNLSLLLQKKYEKRWFFPLHYVAVSKTSFAFVAQQMEKSFTFKIKLPKRRNPSFLVSSSNQS